MRWQLGVQNQHTKWQVRVKIRLASKQKKKQLEHNY